MKARIKGTNIEVDVQPFYSDGQFVGFSDKGVPGYCTYTKEDLIFPDATDCANIDWSSFRREAAKDFISGMLANVSPAANQWTTPEIVSAALEIADELIKQIKQE